MDHIQFLKLQAVERASHGGGDLGCYGSFDLKAEAVLASRDEQIQFNPGVRSPEEALVGLGAEVMNQLAQYEFLPVNRNFNSKNPKANPNITVLPPVFLTNSIVKTKQSRTGRYPVGSGFHSTTR